MPVEAERQIPARVFISATSGDLGTVREIVKQGLLTMHCLPVEQTNFGPDYRGVAEMLAARIGECDAVVHLVGLRYGAEADPATLPPGAARRSYTQMEADIARRLGRKLYLFVCPEDFPYDACDPEPEDKAALQRTYREEVAKSGTIRTKVTSRDDVAQRVRELQLDLEKIGARLRSQRRRSLIFGGGFLLLLAALAAVVWWNSERTPAVVNKAVHEALQADYDPEQIKANLQKQIRDGAAQETGKLDPVKDWEKVSALEKARDQQLLLNLARLDNGQPPQFLASGTINTLDALEPDVFYALFQQGYPIDQLLRVTVERIEINLPSGAALALTNSPARSSRIDTSEEWESFYRFLRVCALLRELQRHGLLQVETVVEFVPLSEAVFDHPETGSKTKGDPTSPPPKPPSGGPGGAPVVQTGPPGSTTGQPATPGGLKGIATASRIDAPAGAPMIAAREGENGFKPTPDEILTAQKEGYVYRKVMETVRDKNGKPILQEGYQLCTKVQVPTLKLRREDVSRSRQILLADTRITRSADDLEAVERFVDVLVLGFATQGKVKDPASSARTHLILRSFSSSLEAVASEQNLFDALMETDFHNQVPLSESWPILRTRWKDGQQLEPPLIKLNYMEKTYQITDAVAPKGDLSIEEAYARTWNRDVYRLLTALNPK